MKTLKKTLAIVLAAIMAFSMCGVAFAAIPADFTELPKADSDQLNDGDYWYDVEALIGWFGAWGYSRDTVSHYRQYGYYLGNGGNTLYIDYRTTDAPYNKSTGTSYYFDGIAPHGGRSNSMTKLPTADSADLADAALWFDLEGMLASRAAAGEDEYALSVYEGRSYFANYNGSQVRAASGWNEVNLDTAFDPEEEIQYLLDFVHMHRATDYIEIPTQDSDDLLYGAYWYDLDGLLTYLQANGMSGNQVSGYYNFIYKVNPADENVRMYASNGDLLGDSANEYFSYLGSFLRKHGVDPMEGFSPLPESDAGLEPGKYWFDKAGYVPYALEVYGFTPEDEAYQNMLNIFNAMDFYLSEDGQTLRTVNYGMMYDISVSTTDEYDMMLLQFLHQVEAADPTVGFKQLPYSDDGLVAGEYWYDLYGMIEGLELDEEEAMFYTEGRITFWLNARGMVLRLIYDDGTYDDITAENDEDGLFDYLMRVPGFVKLPNKTNYIEPGDMWFDAYKYADDMDDSDYIYEYYYYLHTDGNTLKVRGMESVLNEQIGDYEYPETYYTRADDPEMFAYIRTLAPFGDPLPTSDAGLANGAYWFDLAGLLEFYHEYFDYYISDEYGRSLAQLRELYDQAVAEEDTEAAASYEAEILELEAEIANDRAENEAYLAAYEEGSAYLSSDEYVLRFIYTEEEEYKNEDATPYCNLMLWDFLHKVGVNPDAGFNPIPTKDSEDLAQGAYWYDLDSFIDALFQGEGASYYRMAKFFISDDGNTLRVKFFGETTDYSRNDADTKLYFRFLRQHGVDPYDGYILLPLGDSDELEYGAYYYDIDGLLELMENGEEYSNYSYYLSTDHKTLLLAMPTIDLECTENNEFKFYLLFVKQHGVDPREGFIEIPVLTAEDDLDEALPYGGWYLDYDAYFEAEFEGSELTSEERRQKYEQELAEMTAEALILLYNPDTNAFAEEYDGMFMVLTPAIIGEKVYNAAISAIKEYDPWINVKLSTNGLAAGDYWLDVVNYVDDEEWVDFFLDFVQKVDILPELAAIRLTELAEVDETVEEIITIYTPEGDFAQQYEEMAQHIYKTFAHSKDSTCTEAGYENAVAITMDNETVILVPGTELGLADHTPGAPEKENDNPSTCKDLGSYDLVTYCTVCEQPISTQHCTYSDLGAHQFGDMVREVSATCTKTGVKAHKTCSVCKKNFDANGAVIEDLTIPTVAHTPKATVKENVKPATCTAAGSYDEVVYCSVCDNVVSRTTKTVAATGHTWGGWAVTTPATATEKGTETRECSVCHVKETRDIAPTGTGDNGGNNGGNTDNSDKLCKWCGKDHSGNFWQRIVGFFHKILYFFAHLFGLR